MIDNDSQMIWIGNEAGKVNRFCISASKNALATQALLRREFTQDEWNYYIGKSVPYRTFKKTHPLTPPIKGGEKIVIPIKNERKETLHKYELFPISTARKR